MTSSTTRPELAATLEHCRRMAEQTQLAVAHYDADAVTYGADQATREMRDAVLRQHDLWVQLGDEIEAHVGRTPALEISGTFTIDELDPDVAEVLFP